jgi:hypothetical protein
MPVPTVFPAALLVFDDTESAAIMRATAIEKKPGLASFGRTELTDVRRALERHGIPVETHNPMLTPAEYLGLKRMGAEHLELYRVNGGVSVPQFATVRINLVAVSRSTLMQLEP